jgi:hypothetical protein
MKKTHITLYFRNRFEMNCFKYDAPTLMIIKAHPLASDKEEDTLVLGLLIYS